MDQAKRHFALSASNKILYSETKHQHKQVSRHYEVTKVQWGPNFNILPYTIYMQHSAVDEMISSIDIKLLKPSKEEIHDLNSLSYRVVSQYTL